MSAPESAAAPASAAAEPRPFAVPVTVRGYETDAQGHLNQSVYLQYAEHARWSLMQAAGIRQADLLAKGVGPVTLENTVKYRRELHAGDEVEVSCAFRWDGSKIFHVRQFVRRVADGVVAAEVTGKAGVLDLSARRLLDDARRPFLELATDPALLGLPT